MLELVRSRVTALSHRLQHLGKNASELSYWTGRAAAEITLTNSHYERVYTDQFQLGPEFFAGKRVLDIGCGPRGSLEWMTEAAERVGLDPLVEEYRRFGIDRHKMSYVAAPAEAIPFPDGHFDIVTSINSLDHVDDVDATIREIVRVTRPGGVFLVSVEIGHKPTRTEPISLWLDLVDTLEQWYDVQLRAAYELPAGHMVNDAYLTGGPFREERGKHPGVLVLRLHKTS
jgi:SAM-dependent methyltransferase